MKKKWKLFKHWLRKPSFYGYARCKLPYELYERAISNWELERISLL